jgi:hypothetical protein
MPHEFRTHAVLGIETRLERQHAEDEIDGFADSDHARLARRPDLRAHVLHGRNARSLESRCDGQVEVRGINADEDVRTLAQQALYQSAPEPQKSPQVRQHLGKAHDRELLCAVPGLAAGRAHARPANAEELRFWNACAYRVHEARAESIAGGFSCDDRNP